jgi:hypothetical protein
MEFLNPIWNQEKPSLVQIADMCQRVSLEQIELMDSRLDAVLNRIRRSHVNGGALFASFSVGTSKTFDWFASRNRLNEHGILNILLRRVEISNALPALKVEAIAPGDLAVDECKLANDATMAALTAEVKEMGGPKRRTRLHSAMRCSIQGFRRYRTSCATTHGVNGLKGSAGIGPQSYLIGEFESFISSLSQIQTDFANSTACKVSVLSNFPPRLTRTRPTHSLRIIYAPKRRLEMKNAAAFRDMPLPNYRSLADFSFVI